MKKEKLGDKKRKGEEIFFLPYLLYLLCNYILNHGTNFSVLWPIKRLQGPILI